MPTNTKFIQKLMNQGIMLRSSLAFSYVYFNKAMATIVTCSMDLGKVSWKLSRIDSSFHTAWRTFFLGAESQDLSRWKTFTVTLVRDWGIQDFGGEASPALCWKQQENLTYSASHSFRSWIANPSKMGNAQLLFASPLQPLHLVLVWIVWRIVKLN